jgi:hypothetical protein
MMIKLSDEDREFVDSVERGSYREGDLVDFIKRKLRTPEQKAQMDHYDWSVEEVLNGRNDLTHNPEEQQRRETFVDQMFKDWNEKLGGRMKFGY